MSKYEATYRCGYCKKITPIEDKDLGDYIFGPNPKLERTTPCSCGHFSYASGITFKAELDTEAWRGYYGTSEED